jgi:hypothetical protein
MPGGLGAVLKHATGFAHEILNKNAIQRNNHKRKQLSFQ